MSKRLKSKATGKHPVIKLETPKGSVTVEVAPAARIQKEADRGGAQIGYTVGLVDGGLIIPDC